MVYRQSDRVAEYMATPSWQGFSTRDGQNQCGIFQIVCSDFSSAVAKLDSALSPMSPTTSTIFTSTLQQIESVKPPSTARGIRTSTPPATNPVSTTVSLKMSSSPRLHPILLFRHLQMLIAFPHPLCQTLQQRLQYSRLLSAL